MTRLESDVQTLQSARRAQAAVDAHMAAERERANLETFYLEALSNYLDALQALHCPKGYVHRDCFCKSHTTLHQTLRQYRTAHSDFVFSVQDGKNAV